MQSLVLAGLFVVPGVFAGGIWPAPATMDCVQTGAGIPLGPEFKFETDAGSTILTDAFARYLVLLGQARSGHTVSEGGGASLQKLVVTPADTSETLVFGVNESYRLEVRGGVATLDAATVFGALRGLETFTQLAINPGAASPLSVPVACSIKDAPRFAYRGIMMDYARHFYPMSFIKHTIDAMAASKYNILHMHITDDQSFPIESLSVPELTAKGSYGPKYTYTHDDIHDLATYATARGVLLVPEFDMPAHSSAWRAGVPEMMIQCSELFSHGDTMNPTVDVTYSTLDKFLGEMSGLFPPPFLHLGGDEVPTDCWGHNATVQTWMKAHGMATADELESYFVNKVAKLDAVAHSDRTLIYWEEIFNNNVTLPPDTIIQGWKSGAIGGVIARGHRATNSFGWYLNHGCNNYGDGVWTDFYSNDPHKYAAPNATPEQLALIIGGEVTMWGECVDAVNFDGVVWPRAAGAAEQLWSPARITNPKSDGAIPLATYHRLAEHRCRLLSRGIQSAPLNSYVEARLVDPGCQ